MTDHEPMQDQHDDLLAAVNRLTARVGTLSDNLNVSEQQHRRTRMLTVVVVTMLFLGMGFVYNNGNRIEDGVEANAATQVQQCENANSVRESNILLWETIIGFSSGNGEDQSAEEKAALYALMEWIRVLYQQRDCQDLDRVYKAPPPPDFSQIIKDENKVSGNRP